MNVFNHYRAKIEDILTELRSSGLIPDILDTHRISVELPRDQSHGDISTNAAMVLAKLAQLKPRELAELISGKLAEFDSIKTVEVAGPGFINIKFDVALWQNQVKSILEDGDTYGDINIGNGQSVNVEFVSANPTGPMHVGHSRGAVIGDVLASLLAKAGFKVVREYYINDAGTQIDILARSVHLRYREALGEEIGTISEGLYPGEYLVELAGKLVENYGDSLASCPENSWLPIIRKFAISEMLSLIKTDLAALGISHDRFVSEQDLHDGKHITAAFEKLEGQGLVYSGVLERPKGKADDEWEEREQYLFRSTKFGDDMDRPLQKSDGSWTYFAADVAYHSDKFRRGFHDMVNIWGADHKGYIKRMQAAVRAVTNGKATLDVRICNLVNLLDDGEPVRMSKRAGSFVTLREVVDKVGKDVVRFMMLTRGSEAPLDFDLKQVLDQSRDNPVFYVQYAHARACSVLRNVGDIFPGILIDDSSLAKADMSLLVDESELALIRILASWPRLVETAALAREPHRIALYLVEIASAFHGLWNKGHDDHSLRFILPESEEYTRSRVALVRASSLVIASGLNIMGVRPVEELR